MIVRKDTARNCSKRSSVVYSLDSFPLVKTTFLPLQGLFFIYLEVRVRELLRECQWPGLGQYQASSQEHLLGFQRGCRTPNICFPALPRHISMKLDRSETSGTQTGTHVALPHYATMPTCGTIFLIR